MHRKKTASRGKKVRGNPEEQHARFLLAAKESEGDEAPDALDKAFRKLNVMAPSRKSIAGESMHRKSKRS
jgi:hypothetical protein